MTSVASFTKVKMEPRSGVEPPTTDYESVALTELSGHPADLADKAGACKDLTRQTKPGSVELNHRIVGARRRSLGHQDTSDHR